jgi:hypothetical protein
MSFKATTRREKASLTGIWKIFDGMRAHRTQWWVTWQMSFECIRAQRHSAADLLPLMSFFNPQGIPEWIHRRRSRSLAKTSDEDETNNAFDEDLDILQAYSLITATENCDIYEMHALIQFSSVAV